MINATLDLSGSDAMARAMRKIGVSLADAAPLMYSWMKLIVEGNRRGILQDETDGNGIPLEPVKYRPLKFSSIAELRPSLRQRGGRSPSGRGAFRGFGPHAMGLHGNLSSYEYRRLGGPPLAPRSQFSRVIVNFQTDYDQLRPGVWQVTWWWEDVVSTKGVPFLRYHFEGAGRLPRRDLRNIRPDDRALIDRATLAWSNDIIRSA